MKKTDLLKFIKQRNKDTFLTTMAFSRTAIDYGLNYAELSNPIKIMGGYSWTTPFGQLENVGGALFLNETKLPVLNNIVATRDFDDPTISKIISGETIAIMWTVEDILHRAEEITVVITRAQAKVILALLDRNHDANHGISWEIIDVYLYDLKGVCYAIK